MINILKIQLNTILLNFNADISNILHEFDKQKLYIRTRGGELLYQILHQTPAAQFPRRQ